jgi:phage shock protein PspC (stress-responsive transcriptional regulator)
MSIDMDDPTTDYDRHDAPPASGWRHTPVSRLPKGQPGGGQLGGVIAGVSRAYGYELRTTRIAYAVATLILPVLWLVYIAAWVLLPPTPATARPVDAVLKDRSRLPLLAATVLVLAAGVIGSLGSWFLFSGAPWGLVLIGLGVLLWASTRRTSTPAPVWTPTPERVHSPFPPPTPGGPVGMASTTGSAVTSPPPDAPRRPRRPIGSISVGIAVLWAGITAVLSALDIWNPPALWMLVSLIGIVMVGLLISTIVNRSWVLPVPFTLLGLVLVSLCVAKPNLDGASGQHTVRPASTIAAQQRHHLATGQLTLDLRDVPLTGSVVTIDANVGMGQLRVLVPDDADVRLSTEVGMGQIQVDDREITSGVRQSDELTVPATAEAPAGTFSMNLEVGMGQILVQHVSSHS